MRWFAVDDPTLRHLLSRFATDGRNGYKNDVPSNDAVFMYRAQHSDIFYRRIENKEYSKLTAENYPHIDTFFRTLD